MAEILVLGIDCGGTHTDASLLLVEEQSRSARLLAGAKTVTDPENLTSSINNVIRELSGQEGNSSWLAKVDRVTLGATLEINALLQNKADQVALALSAGPGLDPAHFAIGDYVCIVPGGLDHRGVEVAPLYTDVLKKQAGIWPELGVRGIACVGKFSPRNPAHENMMAKVAGSASALPVTTGHSLSGRLNFPGRIATAYYNAAVWRMHANFLDAVENTFSAIGLKAQARLLKADGGAVPFELSRKEPVHSILSGPAASVMSMLALGSGNEECALLLDIGGTTTDLALLYHGSPVIDRKGMSLKGRQTLVNSLASLSVAIGGDSLLRLDPELDQFVAGPDRIGPAMAFGGAKPTLLDALNLLDGENDSLDRGDMNASREGMRELACRYASKYVDAVELAEAVVANAMAKIVKAAYDLVENINSGPIYTLSGLKNTNQARPAAIYLAGGPSKCLQKRLKAAFSLPVNVLSHFDIANAIGSALTIPTASLEIYADGAKQVLTVPALDRTEKISSSFGLDDAKKKACQLLGEYLETSAGIRNADIEVIEADLFAVLDDYGRGSRDIRVSCQVKPGICACVR